MQVHITGRHVEITDAIRDHIYAKVERCLSGLSRIHEVQVVLELQKRTHTAEVIVKGKDHIHVEAEENLKTCIPRLIRQLKRWSDSCGNCARKCRIIIN